jgi:hypothetical protein
VKTTVYSDADGIWIAWSDHTFTPAPAEHTGWRLWPEHDPGSFPLLGRGTRERDEPDRSLPDVTIKWLTLWRRAHRQLAPAIGLDGTWEMIPGVDEDDIELELVEAGENPRHRPHPTGPGGVDG